MSDFLPDYPTQIKDVVAIKVALAHLFKATKLEKSTKRRIWQRIREPILEIMAEITKDKGITKEAKSKFAVEAFKRIEKVMLRALPLEHSSMLKLTKAHRANRKKILQHTSLEQEEELLFGPMEEQPSEENEAARSA